MRVAIRSPSRPAVVRVGGPVLLVVVWSLAGALPLAAVPAAAQSVDAAPPVRTPMASVMIEPVAGQIARGIGVDESQIPLNVQVPFDLAASVCGTDADVLRQHAANKAVQCTAQMTTPALDQHVLRQVRGNVEKTD